jgi:hypothetical protein
MASTGPGGAGDTVHAFAAVLADYSPYEADWLQCGKHENAYLALRAAADIAPEEIAGRPAVRQFVRDLITSAPSSAQHWAEDFAHHLEVSR